MAEDRPPFEVAECDVEPHGDGWKVTHKTTGTSALAPDERQARIAGLRLRVLADWTAAEALFRTGDPT